MPVESASVSDLLLGGGLASAIAMWLRERRQGRKDAGQLALDLITAQNGRIDALTLELGRLQGELTAERRQAAELLAANLRLEVELDSYKRGIERRRVGDQ